MGTSHSCELHIVSVEGRLLSLGFDAATGRCRPEADTEFRRSSIQFWMHDNPLAGVPGVDKAHSTNRPTGFQVLRLSTE